MPNNIIKATVGSIIVPKNTLVQPHEYRVATILSWTGHDIEFIPTGRVKTADIRYRKKIWEIKSPKGSSGRTIENNIRAAIKQSNNIIIDLSRIKLPEDKCILAIKNRSKKLGKKYKIMIITKSGRIIYPGA